MLINDKTYFEVLNEIKARIRETQHKVVHSANKELITLYWKIGKLINSKSAWGNKFIENLSHDIALEYPKMQGYSARNLRYMAKFAKEYPQAEILQQVVAKLPWGQNVVLMDRVTDKKAREWYMQQIIAGGWSRSRLIDNIELETYQRQTNPSKTDNFTATLPKIQSELAKQTTKDPYIFDFIAHADELYETQIENALVENITKLLLELGTGFAFLGNQYHLAVGEKDYYIDMLFYNMTLRCYVVIELKNTEFQPEFAGKLNFYLNAVDDILKTDQDNPTIGLLLCQSKDNLIVEYALKNMSKPIGVSGYKLSNKVPKGYENVLPSADDIKTRIKSL